MGVGAECEGMNDPGVLDVARGLEVCCGVGGGAAASPQQEHASRAREVVLGVAQDHAGVVTGRVNVVRAGVVNLGIK